MALFYTGYRPILRGQSDSDWVNTYTGKLGVYSNWSLMSRHQALEGAPQSNHVPGTGYFPGDVAMTQMFLGKGNRVYPLRKAGLGKRPYDGINGTSFGPGIDTTFGNRNAQVSFGHSTRFRPWEYKGLAETKVFQPTFGHVAFRDVPYAFFVNWFFHGLPADQTLLHPGHAIRPPRTGYEVGDARGPGLGTGDIKDGTGPAASFGFFSPWTFKGVVSAHEVQNPGQAATSGIYNNAYLNRDHVGGHNRVNEWIGVTASNALGTGAGRHHRGNH